MVSFCIGTTLIIDGIFIDPLFGKQYIKTNIKITHFKLNNLTLTSDNINSYYSFEFNDFFVCKTCIINNNICSYDSPCPNIIVGNNYTYFCDCTTFTCGFKEYKYYTSNAFIVLMFGVAIITTILFSTCIRYISKIKYKKNNTKVFSENKFDTIKIDINIDI